MSKPQAEKGMNCPLFRKDVSKVCHRCALFQPLTFEHLDAAGAKVGQSEHWACAYTHQYLLQRETVAALKGGQAAMEDFRNKAFGESQENLKAAIADGQHRDKVSAEIFRRVVDGVRALTTVVERLTVLAPPDRPAQIEHKRDN